MPGKYIIAILGLLLLSACGPALSTGEEAADSLKDNVYESATKLKDWAMTPPNSQKPLQPVADSYCYYAYQDILCMRQQMPGWQFRLVGYQGTNAKAPPPAIMEPLPVRASDVGKPSGEQAAAAPVVKPIFDSIPAPLDSKDTGKTQSTEPQDVSHEPLPDPALAPQL